MDSKPGADDKTIYITRHHPDGGAANVPCTLARIGQGYINEAIRLHDDVAHGISHEIFAAFCHEDIMRFLGPENLAMGILYEGKLVSLRTVKLEEAWANESLDSFGVVRAEGENPAVTGFCVVDKEFRGNNVQFLTQYLVENAVAKRHTGLVTTVSPKNIFSLSNVLNCNFRIIGLTRVYNGLQRYVLKKDFRQHQPRLLTHGHLQISIRDAKGQANALKEGMQGYKLIRKARGFHILYAESDAAANGD